MPVLRTPRHRRRAIRPPLFADLDAPTDTGTESTEATESVSSTRREMRREIVRDLRDQTLADGICADGISADGISAAGISAEETIRKGARDRISAEIASRLSAHLSAELESHVASLLLEQVDEHASEHASDESDAGEAEFWPLARRELAQQRKRMEREREKKDG